MYSADVMQMLPNKKQITSLAAFGAVVTVIGLAFSMQSTSVIADTPVCYGPYGQQIECPVANTSFSIEKLVRRANTSDTFVESINTLDGVDVEFKIVVKNTGDTTVNDVRLIDILPTNLTVKGATEFTITSFAPMQERIFTVVATSNVVNLANGETKCVVNVANLLYRGEKSASDTAQVCVKKGDVLATKLPATGISESATVGMFIVTILSGAIIVNSTLIAEKVRGKK